jgi:hypothetical protein
MGKPLIFRKNRLIYVHFHNPRRSCKPVPHGNDAAAPLPHTAAPARIDKDHRRLLFIPGS